MHILLAKSIENMVFMIIILLESLYFLPVFAKNKRACVEWRDGVGLDEPRYGHACLHTRLNGRDGILLAGGPLAGRYNVHACLHTRLTGRIGILLGGGPLAGSKPYTALSCLPKGKF